MVLETKVWRVDYRKIEPKCHYCDQPSTVIAVSSTTTSDLLVRTLCDEHGKGEQHHCIEQGMVHAGQTSIANAWTSATLMDPVVLAEMAETAKADPELLDDAVDALEQRRGLPTVPLDPEEKKDD